MKSLRTSSLICIAIVSLAMSGCAATVALMPDELDAIAKRFSPPPEKANIYVTRTSHLGSAILFTVYLDGKLVGSIATDTYMLFEVAPGEHQVVVITPESQASLTLDAEAARNYFVEVIPKFGWAHARAALEELTREEG